MLCMYMCLHMNAHACVHAHQWYRARGPGMIRKIRMHQSIWILNLHTSYVIMPLTVAVNQQQDPLHPPHPTHTNKQSRQMGISLQLRSTHTPNKHAHQNQYLVDRSRTLWWKYLQMCTVCTLSLSSMSASSRNLLATRSKASSGHGWKDANSGLSFFPQQHAQCSKSILSCVTPFCPHFEERVKQRETDRHTHTHTHTHTCTHTHIHTHKHTHTHTHAHIHAQRKT